jgi:hypothetical protein
MKLKHAWIAALFTFSAGLAHAAEGITQIETAPGQASFVNAIEAKATVTAIDLTHRKVSLKNSDNQTLDIIAGEQVTNLPSIKVGDTVSLKYLQMLDLELIKGTAGVRKRVVEVAADKAGAGETPSGGAVIQETVYGDVIGVDKAQQTVTVKGVDQTITLKVFNPDQLALIATGDQIKAVHTKAIGLGIEPAKE